MVFSERQLERFRDAVLNRPFRPYDLIGDIPPEVSRALIPELRAVQRYE